MKPSIEDLKLRLSVFESGIDGAIDGCADANPESLVSAREMLAEHQKDKKNIHVMHGLTKEMVAKYQTSM